MSNVGDAQSSRGQVGNSFGDLALGIPMGRSTDFMDEQLCAAGEEMVELCH